MSDAEVETGTHIPGEENLDTSGAVLSAEEKAKAVGWYEKDGGLGAQEFLDKRNDHVGLLRKDVGKLEAQLAESIQTTNAMAEFMQKNRADAERQGYDRAIAQAKAEQKAAIEESDGDAFEQAAKRIDSLEERKAKVEDAVIVKPQEKANPIQVAIQDHQKEHSELFDTSAKAELWEKELRYQGTRGVTFEDAVKAADAVVRKEHMPARPHLGPVDGETSEGKASSLSEIAGGEAAYQAVKRNNPEYTREEFLRVYNTN